MLRLMSLSSLVLLLLVHGGCASGTANTTARGTPIAVTDVGMVVGRWAGLSDLPGHRNDDEYVEVTLHDDGTYEATSARTIGFMDAHGRVALNDGRLLITGNSGSNGTATLYSIGGQQTLWIEMTTVRAGNVTARLRPKP